MAHLTPEENWARVCGPLGFTGIIDGIGIVFTISFILISLLYVISLRICPRWICPTTGIFFVGSPVSLMIMSDLGDADVGECFVTVVVFLEGRLYFSQF